MIRLNQRRKGLFQVTGATDRVIAGVAVVRGGSVLQISGHIDVMPVQRLAIEEVVNFSLKAYMIPVPDFDTSIGYDVLWDRFVPKDDSATDTIDIDEAAADTDPEDEPGSVDLERILGLHGSRLIRVFDRKTEFSVAGFPRHIHLDTTHFYWPSIRIPVRINRKISASEPSVVVFGMSSPNMGEHTTTLHVTPTIQEWAKMLFLPDTLTDMLKQAIGAVETGAETPYVEAQALIVKLMAPKMIEEATRATDYLATSLEVGVDLNFKVGYPDNEIRGELSAE